MKRIASCRPIFQIGLSAAGVSLGASLSLYAVAEDATVSAALVRFSSAPSGNQVLARDPKTLRLVVDGIIWNVDGATPKDSYEVINKGTLNVDGAAVAGVKTTESTVNLNNSVVEGALKAYGSTVNINNSRLVSETEALIMSRGAPEVPDRSVVSVKNSLLSGTRAGASVGGHSILFLDNSSVLGVGVGGDSFGIRLGGSTLDARSESIISGGGNGLYIGTDYGVPGSGEIIHVGESTVLIDNSTVQGVNGAAIRVWAPRLPFTIADITIQNHSTLLSGNGNLLEVDGGSTANFTVDNSTLTGNLVADDTSTLNVTLRNNAQLTGDVINGNNLSINSGAQWQMVGDNAVKTLNLNGGGVSFGADGFHTLSLGQLSGSGAFAMNIDLDAGVGDLLEVNGQANGDFTLKVKNTGVESVSPDIQPLQVVHTEGGDAQFNLLGNRVDLGVFSYELEKQGTDWFIVGSGKTISPSTQSALALFNAAPNIWMSELSTLRSRMGEVRTSGEGGGWIRAYGNRFNATTSAGVDYEQRQSGMSFGADAPVPVSSGQLLIGLLGGYNKSDLDLSRGTSGNVDSYYVGAYGTWLSEEGYYVDGVLKLNKFHNESELAMSDQTKSKGSYTNTGIGGSVEFGKHIKLADDFFLEPFAQMAAVVIQGDHYTLDNGLEAKNNRTQSVLGKVGTSVGRNIALKDGGVLQPYVRVAVAHEFARSNEVTVNDTRFNNELFGSRAELGAGVAVSLSKRLQVHADFDYMKGNNVEQPWGANVGVRFAF